MYENSAPKISSLQLVVMQWPFDNSGAYHARKYLQKDVDFVVRWSLPIEIAQLFLGGISSGFLHCPLLVLFLVRF